MLAYIVDRYGGPGGSRFADMPNPEIGSTDLLIDVRAAGLNPVDFKFRQGKLKVIHSPRLPFVLGNELAGVVLSVGSDVRSFKAGDRVFCRVAREGGGAFAERAKVAAEHAALIPDGIDFVTAAAVPLAGLTALQALRDELAIKEGDKLLISGGAGGVGTFAIQIAKWLGAHVATTASKRGEALVRSLGCDEVIDYTTSDLSKLKDRFDAGFDLIGGKTLDQMFAVMKPGTEIVSIAALPEPQTALKDLGNRRLLSVLFWIVSLGIRSKARRAKVHYRYLFMRPDGAELGELGNLILQHRLTPIIDRTFPFAKIQEALAYLEQGHAKGKVVVVMDASTTQLL